MVTKKVDWRKKMKETKEEKKIEFKSFSLIIINKLIINIIDL